MQQVTRWGNEQGSRAVEAWNRFWFSARDPTVLGVMRILTGLMLLYTHAVWSLDLTGFLGPDGRIPAEHVRLLYASPEYPQGDPFAWSHLFYVESSAWSLWAAHGLALVILALFTVGLATRVTSILAFLITVSYSHRLASAQFGLDQINAMLAMYLMVGPSGHALSVDRWWRWRQSPAHGAGPTVLANVATRLLQIHLCIIYLFAGAGKLLGPTWWEGTALWGAIANQEYQTLDLTWLAAHPWLVNLLTHVTLGWELSYCFLIWRPTLRPWMLAIAVPVHLGIGLTMGMATFGLVMLIANLAFVDPQWLARWIPGRLRMQASNVPAAPGGQKGETAAPPPKQTAKPAV